MKGVQVPTHRFNLLISKHQFGVYGKLRHLCRGGSLIIEYLNMVIKKAIQMGKIFTASCDCGYTKDDIYVGGGMLNFRTYDPFPHYCPNCKIIFEGNLRSEETICCDECGSDDVLSFFDKKICKPEVVQQIDTQSNDNSLLHRILKVFRKSKRIETRKPAYEICELEINKFLCPTCGEFSLVFDSDVLYD